jgi:signal transduction histidine kinase
LQSKVEFRVIVDGAPRPVRPAIRDEIYLIGHEALSNAFRHSQASDVEVELEYAASYLRILIRDNGSGIDPQVVRAGRDGHWGLSGMKERSQRIGGQLRLLSRAAAGTEVELSVPARIAFESHSSDCPTGWLSLFNPGKRRNPKSERKKQRAR